ncbi:MAG: hypothetical protein IJ216_03480 [Acidaminococcaceae bacterium]|nr:hypothetical protein [Acidaminococcaceae bacterium]
MHDAIRGFFTGRKKDFIAVVVGLAVLLVGFCSGYFCGIRNAERTDSGGISNNGNGIDGIREQYQHIESNQHEITDGLESAVGRSDDAAATAGRIEERAGATTQSVTDAAKLIDDCQQLIGQIRNRGKTRTAKD